MLFIKFKMITLVQSTAYSSKTTLTTSPALKHGPDTFTNIPPIIEAAMGDVVMKPIDSLEQP